MPFIKRTLPLLLGIFLLSVIVRLPQLGRPLSRHHEFCTAVSLRIMQIWYDNGAHTYGYNPVMTFNNPADKYINNDANTSGKMIDSLGNYYYVSHPPLAYYAPYTLFKVLHVRPQVLILEIFNLLLHFISGLFVYFMVCVLSFNRARSLPYRPAIVAFVIYIFMPVTLWFQGNVYMSDMAVHTLFIIGVYITLKMIIRQKFYSLKYIFFYVVCLGLMIYTSWLGVFFALGVMVYSLLHIRSVKGFNVLLWSTAMVTLMMLRLIMWQYAQIDGPRAYLEEMISRYVWRGSLEGTDQGFFHFMFAYLWLIKTLLYNYIIHYIVIYVIIGMFSWLAISRKKLKIVFSENGYRFIWLSVLPVLLLHFFFLNYSVQDFTALYGSLFFSVLVGILYDKVKKSGVIPARTLHLGLLAAIILMVAEYEGMNWKRDTSFYDSGISVRDATQKDEVLFTHHLDLQPQMIYYAGRNIRYVNNEQEALEFLKFRHINHGFIIDDAKHIDLNTSPAL